jgi:hypothetical protein
VPTTLLVAGSMSETSSPALFVWMMRTLAADRGNDKGSESSTASDHLMAGKTP